MFDTYKMFIIYSVNYKTCLVEYKDFDENYSSALIKLDDIVRNLVRKENGDIRALDAFKHNVENLQIEGIPDGYHLFLHKGNNMVDVYKRTTSYQHGWVFSSVNVNVEKECYYSIMKISDAVGVKEIDNAMKKTTPREHEHGAHVSYISELKDVLRSKVIKSVEEIEEKIKESKK